MDRAHFYTLMGGSGEFDYEIYLNTQSLLACQKNFDQLCNRDELQFMVVHQVEELWMKLIAYTLLEVDEQMAAGQTNRVLTLFARVHQLQKLMTSQLTLLESMSPKDYQIIRLHLGHGSGQESPGFKVLMQMFRPLWQTFSTSYLVGRNLTLDQVYNSEYSHGESYAVAEALIEYDELFQKFRFHHIMLIHRSIGMGSKSLKGRPVEILDNGMRQRFFPELWEVRNHMTDSWGTSYGVVRDGLGAR